MKQHHAQSFISQITDSEGMTSSDPMFIENTFIAHFTSIIAPQLDDINTDLSHVSAFGHLSAEDGTKLTQPVAVEAFENSINSANSNKAPGPDEFNAHLL